MLLIALLGLRLYIVTADFSCKNEPIGYHKKSPSPAGRATIYKPKADAARQLNEVEI
jgi:hypothetical protein